LSFPHGQIQLSDLLLFKVRLRFLEFLNYERAIFEKKIWQVEIFYHSYKCLNY